MLSSDQALVETVARRLAVVRGHKDTDHQVAKDQGGWGPVWAFYTVEAETIIGLVDAAREDGRQFAGERVEALLFEAAARNPGLRLLAVEKELRSILAALSAAQVENETLRLDLSDAMRKAAVWKRSLDLVEEGRQSAGERVKALEEGLRPFAQIADRYPTGGLQADIQQRSPDVVRRLHAADFYRAAALLSAPQAAPADQKEG